MKVSLGLALFVFVVAAVISAASAQTDETEKKTTPATLVGKSGEV